MESIQFRAAVNTLVQMEARDLMPNDLFEIVYARVEVQQVREEERRNHGGRRDRREPRRLGGSGSPSLGQRGGNKMQVSSYSGDLVSRKSQSLGTTRRAKHSWEHVSTAGK